MYKNTVGFLAPASEMEYLFDLKDQKVFLFNDNEKGGQRMVVKQKRYSDIEIGLKNPEIYWVIRNLQEEEMEKIKEAMKKGGLN